MRRTKRLIVWATPDEAMSFQAAADADDRTLSDFLRLAAKRVAAKQEYVPVLSDKWAEKVRHETAAAIERESGKPHRVIPGKS